MKNILTQEQKDQIDQVCAQYFIKNYTINNDATIDVNQDVNIRRHQLTRLPLNINKMVGYFDCSNNKLTTLEGCPTEIWGAFHCNDNQLTSLEYCPTILAGGGFFYYANNPLPIEFKTLIDTLSMEEELTFFKYQNYYEIWTPEFNHQGMLDLVDEIKEGLR